VTSRPEQSRASSKRRPSREDAAPRRPESQPRGEQLCRAVDAVMHAAATLWDGERVIDVTQLSGGWSRHSYVASTTRRKVVVRAKPSGGLLDTDLEAEHGLYGALSASGVPVPAVLGLEPSAQNAFGGPFFVMSYAMGTAPNVFRRRDRAALQADWDGSRKVAAGVVEQLANIHKVQISPALERVPSHDFLGVVERWQDICDQARLLRDPIVEEAFAWLAERIPADSDERLVHGDYRVGNLLLHDGRVAAVLDWELAYRGDPRFDLGYFALEYTAGRHLRPVSNLLGAVADEEWFFDQYEQRTGYRVDREVVRTFSVLGILMLVATLYTGIKMYSVGQTTDIRMAWNRFELPGLRYELCRLMSW
jgi:aminoglycoside phosphotransferase (APT) family kinase protein